MHEARLKVFFFFAKYISYIILIPTFMYSHVPFYTRDTTKCLVCITEILVQGHEGKFFGKLRHLFLCQGARVILCAWEFSPFIYEPVRLCKIITNSQITSIACLFDIKYSLCIESLYFVYSFLLLIKIIFIISCRAKILVTYMTIV